MNYMIGKAKFDTLTDEQKEWYMSAYSRWHQANEEVKALEHTMKFERYLKKGIRMDVELAEEDITSNQYKSAVRTLERRTKIIEEELEGMGY